jgi:hypothetical protein
MATKKKSATSLYNEFFSKFSRKGYVGSRLKNKTGNSVFEVELDTKKDIDDAKNYLNENGIKYNIGTINSKRLLIKL